MMKNYLLCVLVSLPLILQAIHPVSTESACAQSLFDRGLTYLFAYNHDVALSAFEEAAKCDPKLAMAYWGMAMAVGQDINTDVTPERRSLQTKLSPTTQPLPSCRSPH